MQQALIPTEEKVNSGVLPEELKKAIFELSIFVILV